MDTTKRSGRHIFFGDFSAPCDLIYRDASGVETVIYDCSTTGSIVGGNYVRRTLDPPGFRMLQK